MGPQGDGETAAWLFLLTTASQPPKQPWLAEYLSIQLCALQRDLGVPRVGLSMTTCL